MDQRLCLCWYGVEWCGNDGGGGEGWCLWRWASIPPPSHFEQQQPQLDSNVAPISTGQAGLGRGGERRGKCYVAVPPSSPSSIQPLPTHPTIAGRSFRMDPPPPFHPLPHTLLSPLSMQAVGAQGCSGELLPSLPSPHPCLPPNVGLWGVRQRAV